MSVPALPAAPDQTVSPHAHQRSAREALAHFDAHEPDIAALVRRALTDTPDAARYLSTDPRLDTATSETGLLLAVMRTVPKEEGRLLVKVIERYRALYLTPEYVIMARQAEAERAAIRRRV